MYKLYMNSVETLYETVQVYNLPTNKWFIQLDTLQVFSVTFQNLTHGTMKLTILNNKASKNTFFPVISVLKFL